ncbi:unnamed protein product [marine sediment metagenome]|uniref:Uncharacterized protein n=1 Tax=marine sediment metagenome TaxID=412755 RepID=X1GAV3_9ZZZZ
MENRTAEELKQIAVDLFHGKLFTDRHLQRVEDLTMVFMPFIFMAAKDIRKLKKDPPGMIFEYRDKAGSRSVNGMPMFFSCQMLTQDDTKAVLELCKKLEEAQMKALAA